MSNVQNGNVFRLFGIFGSELVELKILNSFMLGKLFSSSSDPADFLFTLSQRNKVKPFGFLM